MATSNTRYEIQTRVNGEWGAVWFSYDRRRAEWTFDNWPNPPGQRIRLVELTPIADRG